MWAWFLLDRHLDRIAAIAAGLGDDLVNRRPPLPGANSPYQIVVHCCGMAQWWTRSAILGLEVDRDRDAEFTATGTVAEMTRRVDEVRAQLRTDLERIDPAAAPAGDPSEHYAGTPLAATAAGVLLHVLEELAQHHGHLELTRDLLLASTTA